MTDAWKIDPIPITGPLSGLRYIVGLCIVWIGLSVMSRKQDAHLCKVVLDRYRPLKTGA